MSLLDPNDYPSIRRAIDPSLSPSSLPDEVIEEDQYLLLAEARVAREVSSLGLASLSAASITILPFLRVAAVNYTAADVVWVVPDVLGESSPPSFSYHRQSLNKQKIYERCIRRAQAAVALALGTTPIEESIEGLELFELELT